jgi:hypothetical protein
MDRGLAGRGALNGVGNKGRCAVRGARDNHGGTPASGGLQMPKTARQTA